MLEEETQPVSSGQGFEDSRQHALTANLPPSVKGPSSGGFYESSGKRHSSHLMGQCIILA